MESIEGIKTWIDDNIIWYIYDKPKDIYYSVKYWFKCNFNKLHWKLVKTAFTSYGWDYGFLLALEEAQIDKMLDHFEKHQSMVDWQYNQIMRALRIAKYCISIINNDGHDLYEYPTTENDNWLDNYIYKGPKLNWKNSSRFINKECLDFYKKNAHEYYLAKIKHLYYLTREIYTEYWWD